MARTITKRCDICRKQTEKIVGKLLYVSTIRNGFAHSNYTHHADVGVCCQSKLMNSFEWQERTSKEEYLQRRKAV